MRAVLIQDSPVDGDVERNVAHAAAAVAAAGAADLVVLPELYLGGYVLEGIERLALAPGDRALAPLADAARAAGTAVVVGAAERVEGGVANSAFCLDRDGRPVGVYRKTHLFGAERDLFVAGEELRPVRVGGVRLGVMICFDVEFPEVARTLTLRGAELLVTISANMAPFAGDHEAFTRARALENERPHLYVNRTGAASGIRFVGGSRAIDPEGTVVAEAGSEPALLDVQIGAAGRRDERTTYLAQRRPGLYTLG